MLKCIKSKGTTTSAFTSMLFRKFQTSGQTLSCVAAIVVALCSASSHAASVKDILLDDGLVDDPRIYGGSTASTGAWPSLVALATSSSVSSATLRQRLACGGTVIAPRWILTAAHCVVTDTGQISNPANISVVANITDLRDTSAVETLVTNVYPHPNYAAENVEQYSPINDVALIELSTDINAPVNPLYSGDNDLLVGSTGYAAGWGRAVNYEASVVVLPYELQQAPQPFVSSEECNSPEVYDGSVSDFKICAGYKEGGISACKNDSGGPIYASVNGEAVQVGITSWIGKGCGAANGYTVYTSVSAYQNWIRSYVDVSASGNSDNVATGPVSGNAGSNSGGSAGATTGGAIGSYLLIAIFGIVWARRSKVRIHSN